MPPAAPGLANVLDAHPSASFVRRTSSTRLGSRKVSAALTQIDPSQDGADVGFTVLDRVRAEMLHRVGMSDLLKPRVLV